jgi:hypothetical protein
LIYLKVIAGICAGAKEGICCGTMDKTDVWRAVVTLAERLPTTGRMPGDTVVSMVQNALRAL